MSGFDPRDLEEFKRREKRRGLLPKMNRQLWIAVGVVVGLIIVGAVVSAITPESDSPAVNNPNPPTASVEQVTWSIMIGEGRVQLKGDLPNGYPTETWADGELLDRDPDGDFSWDLEARLPSPVSLMADMDGCSELSAQFDSWLAGSDSAPSVDSAMRQLAFAQYALNRMNGLGC